MGVSILAALVCVAVYIPAVQKFAVEKVSVLVERETGIHATIEQFRLRFPAGVSVGGVRVVMPVGDTLAEIGRVKVDAALWPLLRGRVSLTDIALEEARVAWRDTASGMVLRARIDDLKAGWAALDPGGKMVRVGRVVADGGDVAISMGDGATDEVPDADTLPFDWIIDVKRFELREFGFALDMPADSVPEAGSVSPQVTPFDYRHLRAEGVGLAVDGFRFDAGEIAAHFEGLRLVERSGLAVTDGSGEVAMGGEGFSLTGFELATSGSRIEGSATAGAGIVSGEATTPISVELSANVSTHEIALFAPLPHDIGRVLAGSTVTLDGTVGGTLNDIKIEQLTAALPGHLTLKAHGALRSLAAPERLSGSLALEVEAANLDFARTLVADTALRRRLAIPHGMSFRTGVDFSPEKYDLKEFTLTAGIGRLEGKGHFEPQSKSYDAEFRLADFPLGAFLPHDSLGVATLALAARGRGFEPTGLETVATLDVARLEMKGVDYGRITADVAASQGDVTGTIKSRSGLLSTDIAIEGRIARDTIAVGTPAVLRSAPLSYTLAAQLDSTVVRLDSTVYRIDAATLRASASAAGTVAALRSGDLAVDIASPLPPEMLIEGVSRAGGEIERQLVARHFNADSLQSAFPHMTLTALAGRGNFLHEIALSKGFDFRTISADVATVGDEPFHIDAVALGIHSGGLEVDTLGVHALRSGPQLDYELRLANRPATTMDLGLLSVSGSVGGRSLTAEVLQRNSAGEVGFDFGTVLSLNGRTLRAEMAADPVLGYERWTVGLSGMQGAAEASGEVSGETANWIEYDTDGRLRADLRLAGVEAERHIAITTASLPGIPQGALRFTAGGLDLERMLDLLPTAPDVGGMVSSDLTFGFHADEATGNVIAARGTLGAKDFSYTGRRVADIDLDLDFGSDGSGRMVLDGSVGLEGGTALTAKGTYAVGNMDFEVDIPGVPLSIAEGLMPEGMARLGGRFGGKVRIAGTASKPVIEGDVGFTDGSVLVAMTGTPLKISPERITIAGQRVTFRDWGLVAPNNQKLSVNGSVNITDPGNPVADLSIRARDFRFVDSRHLGGSQIYGMAAFDARITARGPLDGMRVRGDIDLSDNTNMVYILRTTSTLRDEKQHTVQFVKFADSDEEGEQEEVPLPVRRGGMDMLIGVGIGEGLRATLSLDEVNENRVELQGGGDLTFSMNPQGDTRLAGRYTLSSGTLYYKPPVIPQKIFSVADGSYVEWTGAMAEPAFHIAATQTTEVRLDYDDGTPEDVAFDITASIAGSLEKMDMTFDLAAPGNMAIQDQLLAMSPEGRMQQALSLMIYGQYTGPGVSSKGAAFDARAQLNNFISKEINQWARNNLQGVDFSMGIDTRSDMAGDSHTDYSYSVSKTLFSDRVKISIGGKVSDEATSSEGFADNLLEDVTLEYRLTRRDNMFLKLYRYNTRESILEGEVTETGAGFVIRKKVNRLRDIFRRTRQRGGSSGIQDGTRSRVWSGPGSDSLRNSGTWRRPEREAEQHRERKEDRGIRENPEKETGEDNEKR